MNESELATTDPLEELLAGLQTAYNNKLKDMIQPKQKQPYLYLGSIHSCQRHNYFLMSDGDKRKPFEPWTQALLEAGKIWETQVVKSWLNQMGYEVIGGQQKVVIPYPKTGETIATGKIDGMLRHKGIDYPFEIKKMNPNKWARINCVEDLFKDEWTTRYVRQLLMYLYGNNKESGFYLIDDGSLHWKLIPLYLGNHLDLAEKTLRNMEMTWDAHKKGEPPQFHQGVMHLCEKCDFNNICLPTTEISGGDTMDDPDVEAQLAREVELKPLAAEYKELHDTTVSIFKERGSCTVGGKYAVQVKVQMRKKLDTDQLTDEQRKEITVPNEVRLVSVKALS